MCKQKAATHGVQEIAVAQRRRGEGGTTADRYEYLIARVCCICVRYRPRGLDCELWSGLAEEIGMIVDLGRFRDKSGKNLQSRMESGNAPSRACEGMRPYHTTLFPCTTTDMHVHAPYGRTICAGEWAPGEPIGLGLAGPE